MPAKGYGHDSTSTLQHFDPDRVALFEAEGWRAYYDRSWLKLLWLIVKLSQEQFHIPFPKSLEAAYFIVRGASAYVPIEHDMPLVLACYERFYRLARRYSGLTFGAEHVAALEVRYNDDHRRLVGSPDKSELVQTLTELHCALFGLSPERARESAEWRVLAASTVDRITHRTSTNVSADWERIEDYLRRCYRSIQRESKK